jgi:proteasome lid subunit RPN8/RPN11
VQTNPTTHPSLTLADAPHFADALAAHAAQCMPHECCGLVVRSNGSLAYWPCANAAPAGHAQDYFVLEPADWAAAEDAGEIVAVCHSHPNSDANPSEADLVMCQRSGLPWFVIGWPSGVIKVAQPDGYAAPLVGRNFFHGVLDCYTLLQDYYQRTLAITLPHYTRNDNWWKLGQDLYTTQFASAGFVQVDAPPQLHDVLLMQVHSDVANHAAVYLGDGKILHHLHSRLSCEDVYGGYWERHTVTVLRHSQAPQQATAAATIAGAL